MNKTIYKLVIPVLIIVELSFIFLTFKAYSNKEVNINPEISSQVNQVSREQFSMYLEQDDGTYAKTEETYWPTEGYKFNKEKTVCVDTQGNEVEDALHFNDGKMTIRSNRTVFCNLYFDTILVLLDGPSFNATIPNDTTEILFTDVTAPNNISLTNLSNDGSESIVGWSEGTSYYISSQLKGKKIFANPNSSYMFYSENYLEGNTLNVKYIDVSLLDTSKAYNLSHMFYYVGYNALDFKILGLDGWDVSNVNDMSSSLHSMAGSATVFDIGDLSKWDVSNVTNMHGMFESLPDKAYSINLGDLSGWDVSNVTNMRSMFGFGGEQSTYVYIGDISGWDVSNVTNMEYMFSYTFTNTTWSLNCSKWDVSNVTSYTGFNSGSESKVTLPEAWK